MFSGYFNQKIGWGRYNKDYRSAWGETYYYQMGPIPARVDLEQTMLIGKDGREIVSSGRVLTQEPLGEGDRIEHLGHEWIVHTSKPVYDMMGQVVYWEARI